MPIDPNGESISFDVAFDPTTMGDLMPVPNGRIVVRAGRVKRSGIIKQVTWREDDVGELVADVVIEFDVCQS